MFPQICTNSIVGHHSGTLFWYGAFLWSLKQGQSTGTPFAILSHFAPISLIWIFIFWISTKPLIIFSLFLSHLVQVCPTKKWTKRTKMGHLFKQSHFGMFICQKSWKNGAKWDTMSYYVQCMSQRSKMGQECPILECLFAKRVKKPEQNGTPCPTMSSACPNGPKWDRSVPSWNVYLPKELKNRSKMGHHVPLCPVHVPTVQNGTGVSHLGMFICQKS